MGKNNYKLILIKEGQFDLKQINLSTSTILLGSAGLLSLFIALFFLMSNTLINFTLESEIDSHRENNKEFADKINEAAEKLESIDQQLSKIKLLDDNLRKMAKLPTLTDDIRKLGVGGDNKPKKEQDFNYLLPEDVEHDLNLIFEKTDYFTRLVNLEFISYEEIDETISSKISYYHQLPAIHPVQDNYASSSGFGYRKDPFSRKYTFHSGDDFSARVGTPVVSTGEGRVKTSKVNGSFGNYIEIDHGNGFTTIYAHLSRRHVKKGQKVFRGQKIGEVGNTGRSTAPHLHYEVKYGRKSLDPSQYYFDSL